MNIVLKNSSHLLPTCHLWMFSVQAVAHLAPELFVQALHSDQIQIGIISSLFLVSRSIRSEAKYTKQLFQDEMSNRKTARR